MTDDSKSSGRGKGRKPTRREKNVRVKTARGRKNSSTLWLRRQLNDPYVKEAKRLGYRSRAVFKLKEIDEKHHLLKKGQKIVDLGAAPGGWSQLAVEKGAATVIAMDLLKMDDIPGVTCLQMDFSDDEAPDTIKDLLQGHADIVMSDMAPNTIGHRQTDHVRMMALVEMAAYFAADVLRPGGVFVAKVFQGGAEKSVLDFLKSNFEQVKHVKPKASRSDSAEQFILATGFKGAVAED